MMLKEPANAAGLRHITIDIERLIDNWERLSNNPFDEEAKVGKPRELTPSSIWCYIAQSARGAKTYRELVTLVVNQMTDPKTGMLQGETQPTIHELWQPEQLDAVGKGKAKGDGKCWNCGEAEHFPEIATNPKVAEKEAR